MNLKFKTVAIIVGVILVFLLLNQCSRHTIIRGLGGYTEQKTKIEIDTFYTKGKIDTTEVFYSYVRTNGIRIGKDSIVYKYKYKNPESGNGDIVEVDSVRLFELDITDKWITGKFSGVNDFEGNFLHGSLNYKRLFPKYITRVDTIRINTTTTKIVSNSKERFGVGVGVNSMLAPSGVLSWTTKKDWQFMYDYTHILKGTNLILNDNQINNIHSIKVIKNF